VALRLGSLLLAQFGFPPAEVAETASLMRGALERRSLEVGRAQDQDAEKAQPAAPSAAAGANGRGGDVVAARRAPSSATAEQFDRNIVPADVLRQSKAARAAAAEPVSVSLLAPALRPTVFQATSAGGGTAGVDYCILPDEKNTRIEESDLPDLLELRVEGLPVAPMEKVESSTGESGWM
jgi:hypothetical protein